MSTIDEKTLKEALEEIRKIKSRGYKSSRIKSESENELAKDMLIEK